MVATQASSTIPKWLAPYLKSSDLAEVATAVRQVEVRTSGEVVPMVVRRSMVIGHVFPLALLLLVVAYAGGKFFWQEGSWHGEQGLWPILELSCLLPVAWGLSRLSWVQRLLTMDEDMRTQVWRRAEAEFFSSSLYRTADASGILIFVSLAERQAVVLADAGIAKILPAHTWDEIVAQVITQVHDGGLGKGLVTAVDRCGALLAEHFPIQDQDRNEIADRLIIKQ